VVNGWYRDLNEVLIIGLHMVVEDWVWVCLRSSLRFKWKLKRTEDHFYFSLFCFFCSYFSFFSFFIHCSFFCFFSFLFIIFMPLRTFKQHSTYCSSPLWWSRCVEGVYGSSEIYTPEKAWWLALSIKASSTLDCLSSPMLKQLLVLEHRSEGTYGY
jgi:hypothetical protein